MDGINERGQNALSDLTGCVFNIQRYAIHDGPGIRTTVFLKGCPLVCLWCDNPESQMLQPQIFFWQDRCIRCGTCIAVCPRDAITADDHGNKMIDVSLCDMCGVCVDECYPGALEQVGSFKSVKEVIQVVLEDRLFYENTGGGMTLSGGEPLAQPEFCLALLKTAREYGIHTAIETTGQAAWVDLEKLLPYLDLVLYDVKEVDDERHQRFIGGSNRLILDNLKRLAGTDKQVIIRRPIVPGYNDDPESIHALGQFVQQLGTVRQVDLLPYHRMGQNKYAHLEREYALGDTPTMNNEEAYGLRDILLTYGIKVKIGG